MRITLDDGKKLHTGEDDEGLWFQNIDDPDSWVWYFDEVLDDDCFGDLPIEHFVRGLRIAWYLAKELDRAT